MERDEIRNLVVKAICDSESLSKVVDEIDGAIKNQGSIFSFDCWKRDGVIETKQVEALNVENAKIIFEYKYPNYGYDEPYK